MWSTVSFPLLLYYIHYHHQNGRNQIKVTDFLRRVSAVRLVSFARSATHNSADNISRNSASIFSLRTLMFLRRYNSNMHEVVETGKKRGTRRSEVTTMTMKIHAFFYFTTWRVVEIYRRFGGTYCLMFAIHDDRSILFGNVGKFPPDDASPRDEIRYAVSSTCSASIKTPQRSLPKYGNTPAFVFVPAFPTSLLHRFHLRGQRIRRVEEHTSRGSSHSSSGRSLLALSFVNVATFSLRQIILYSIFRTPFCTSTG